MTSKKWVSTEHNSCNISEMGQCRAKVNWLPT